MYIFVYGTLKRNHGAYRLHKEMTEYVGEATADGSMWSCGAFPAVTFSGEGKVKGEVFKVLEEDVVPILDRYEGVPFLYIKLFTKVTLESGEEVVALAYEYAKDTSNLEKVESGVWL